MKAVKEVPVAIMIYKINVFEREKDATFFFRIEVQEDQD